MATFVPIRGTQAQILATPIVDGQMLIETDQGNFNKIYLDVNTTRSQVGGHSGGTGSTLVVTTTESTLYGKTVSVVIDGTTYTGTFNSSGTVVIDSIIKVGNATVTSTDGVDTATNYVSMPYYGLYTIALSFFSATVTVTFPHSLGAVCTLSDGTATLVATTSPMNFIVGNVGTWEATVTLDGIDKTDSVQITADGQTKSMTIEYGTINLTLDADFVTASSTITCVQSGTTISKTALSTSMTFYPPTTGNWTISGVIGADTFYSSPNPVNIASLSTPVSADLQTLPNGQTVLPTDDIQIWLNCAGIYDKTSYSTLADVLADDETLQKLINDHNAVDYLKRSTTWIVNKALIPVMTSSTTPSGTVTSSGERSGFDAWRAFDGNITGNNFWAGDTTGSATNKWLEYDFPSPIIAKSFDIVWNEEQTSATYQIEAYDDLTSNWIPISSTFTQVGSYSDTLNTNKAYTKYRLFVSSSTATAASYNTPRVALLQLYSIGSNGITQDSNAMTYIGLRDYAANTLLSDADWCDAIANSTYYYSVLNVEIPVMTGFTTPSGEVPTFDNSSLYPNWHVYDQNISTHAQISGPSYYLQPNYYKFTTPQKCIIAEIGGYGWESSNAHRILTYKIQASNDGNTWEDLSDVITNDATTSGSLKRIPLSPTQSYLYYALTPLTTNTANVYQIESIQFYGREDVGTDYIYVASAADDTITATPQGGGSAITITTDSSGKANVLPTNLPSGTYTFTSSVANDPDNSSNYYSKNINIFNGMIMAKVMPDNSLYWYGYIDTNYGELSTANGWKFASAYSSSSFYPPLYSTNHVRCQATGTGAVSNASGMGNKAPIIMTKIHTILSEVSGANMNYTTVKEVYNTTGGGSLTPQNGYNVNTISETTGYITILSSNLNSRYCNIIAIWYE